MRPTHIHLHDVHIVHLMNTNIIYIIILLHLMHNIISMMLPIIPAIVFTEDGGGSEGDGSGLSGGKYMYNGPLRLYYIEHMPSLIGQ